MPKQDRTRRPMPARRVNWLLGWVFAGWLLAAVWVTTPTPVAEASPPDISFPYCPGGGVVTSWGGYCDGRTFPDGTKWHQDSFWAPFVGRVWNPIVCVVANAPAPPPLAGPGGCGGGY